MIARGDKRFWKQVGEYTSLGVLLPAATFVGYAIGWALDRALGTTFLWIVFLLLGIISGLVQIVRYVNRDIRRG